MLRRAELEGRREAPALLESLAPSQTEAVVAAVAEADFDTARLPHDHPQWAKDALTLSTKARELLARLRPVIVTILTFWDHRIRGVSIGNARVSIDPSGSYRIE